MFLLFYEPNFKEYKKENIRFCEECSFHTIFQILVFLHYVIAQRNKKLLLMLVFSIYAKVNK